MTILVIVAAAFAAVYSAGIIFYYGFNIKFGLCGCAIPPEILAYTEEKLRAEGKTGSPVGDRRAEETEMLRLGLTFLCV